MKAHKSLILLVSLTFALSTSMASNKGTEAGESNSQAKNEIENLKNNDKNTNATDIANDIVVMEATNNSYNSIPMDTKNSINDVLTYPTFAHDDQQNDLVVVSFTYTEDGYIKVLSLNSSDEELNPYIISKLENIRLKNGSVTIGKEYFARFQFILL